MTPENLRIDCIEKVTINGTQRKLFTVWTARSPNAFEFAGRYSAPVRVADRDLHHFFHPSNESPA